jgi:hypothetical protein
MPERPPARVRQLWRAAPLEGVPHQVSNRTARRRAFPLDFPQKGHKGLSPEDTNPGAFTEERPPPPIPWQAQRAGQDGQGGRKARSADDAKRGGINEATDTHEMIV